MELIKKSISASLCILLGVFGILSIENQYISAILFTLGLLTICKLKLNLFTGKCGFIFETKDWGNLFLILIVNVFSGYILGYILGMVTPQLKIIAEAKVLSWSFSADFFVRSILCGVIMYVAVKLYREGTMLGIFIGIPLFILCGFQHCIANVIYMGVFQSFNPALILSIVGNFTGSVMTWYLMSTDEKKIETGR